METYIGIAIIIVRSATASAKPGKDHPDVFETKLPEIAREMRENKRMVPIIVLLVTRFGDLGDVSYQIWRGG